MSGFPQLSNGHSLCEDACPGLAVPGHCGFDLDLALAETQLDAMPSDFQDTQVYAVPGYADCRAPSLAMPNSFDWNLAFADTQVDAGPMEFPETQVHAVDSACLIDTMGPGFQSGVLGPQDGGLVECLQEPSALEYELQSGTFGLPMFPIASDAGAASCGNGFVDDDELVLSEEDEELDEPEDKSEILEAVVDKRIIQDGAPKVDSGSVSASASTWASKARTPEEDTG